MIRKTFNLNAALVAMAVVLLLFMPEANAAVPEVEEKAAVQEEFEKEKAAIQEEIEKEKVPIKEAEAEQEAEQEADGPEAAIDERADKKKRAADKKAAKKRPARDKFDAAGKFRVEAALVAGAGFDDVLLGWTTGGDEITLSGGGGAGFNLGLGYGLTSRLEAELKLGHQVSVMTPSVSNADGEFTRGLLLGTLKYRRLVSDRSNLKFGAGLGIYSNGEWDVDTSLIPGGSRLIVEYDNAIGAHATFEYEHIFRGDWSIAAGLRMYFVEYDANAAYQNGFSVPVWALVSELQQLDGSGLDLTLAFSQYF